MEYEGEAAGKCISMRAMWAAVFAVLCAVVFAVFRSLAV